MMVVRGLVLRAVMDGTRCESKGIDSLPVIVGVMIEITVVLLRSGDDAMPNATCSDVLA